MFIGTNYETLLGDMPVASGLNPRLIQMYIGVQWVSRRNRELPPNAGRRLRTSFHILAPGDHVGARYGPELRRVAKTVKGR
jgi:hypothetical protein